jgi:hypothetical protein
MRRHTSTVIVLAAALFAGVGRAQSPATPAAESGQAPAPPAPRRPSALPPGVDRMAYMQTVVSALGVDCGYCHAGRGGNTPASSADTVTATGKQRAEVARDMFLMVDQLNEQVQKITGKAPNEGTRVSCASCHRGVPIPKQIGDIMWQTAMKQGGDAAVAQYRDLRSRFYGRQAYDFGEQALIPIAERLANIKADAAVALMRMNIDFHPESVQSRITLAYSLVRARDYQGAIASLKEALQIDPNNGVAKGMLSQLDQ